MSCVIADKRNALGSCRAVRQNRFSSNMTNEYDWSQDTAPSRQSDLTALRFITVPARLPPFLNQRPWPWSLATSSLLHPWPPATLVAGVLVQHLSAAVPFLLVPQTPGSELCRGRRRGSASVAYLGDAYLINAFGMDQQPRDSNISQTPTEPTTAFHALVYVCLHVNNTGLGPAMQWSYACMHATNAFVSASNTAKKRTDSSLLTSSSPSWIRNGRWSAHSRTCAILHWPDTILTKDAAVPQA